METSGRMFLITEAIFIMNLFDKKNNYLILCRSVVSRRAQCQTTNQKLTVRRGSQHSDPSQGEIFFGVLGGISSQGDLFWGFWRGIWFVQPFRFREELALIENRILEKEMAAKRRAERLAKNIAVSPTSSLSSFSHLINT